MRRALFALLPLPLLSLAVCTPTGDDDDESPAPPTLCETLELPERAWNADGPYGLLRRELIEDFTIELLEEDDWVMSERWSGCESYVFVPDSLNVHQTDPTSLWEQGIADLVARSPRNAHYFFVSTEFNSEPAEAAAEAMRSRIDNDLEDLDGDDAAWWAERLHVVRRRAR